MRKIFVYLYFLTLTFPLVSETLEKRIREWMYVMEYGKFSDLSLQKKYSNASREDLIEKAVEKLARMGRDSAPFLVQKFCQRPEYFPETLGFLSILPHDIPIPRFHFRSSAALFLMGKKALLVVPALKRALLHKRKEVRHDAAMLLGHMEAIEGEIELIRLLTKSKDQKEKYCIIWSLGRMKSVRSIPFIIKHIENPSVRLGVFQALTFLGEKSYKAGPKLIRYFLRSKNSRTKEYLWLLRAMSKLPCKFFKEKVIQKLIFENGGAVVDDFHCRPGKSLTKLILIRSGKKAISVLKKILEDKNHKKFLRASIVDFLSGFSIKDPKIIDLIIQVLKECKEDSEYRFVIPVLSNIGPAGQKAIPYLEEIICKKNISEEIQKLALKSIKKIRKSSPDYLK